MKMTNISKTVLTGIALSALLASCSEDKMDEINRDLNHTTTVPARMMLTDVMTSTAFSVVGGDYCLYGGIYIEHEIGSHNQFYYAENRSSATASSTFNNSWSSAYSTLKNAKIAIDKSVEEKNSVSKGIAEVLAAYNLAVLTDMHGDIPWKEACDYLVSMTPAIDTQEVIYQDIMAYLDAAIADLQGEDLTPIGGQDLIYGGDASKWLKAAYGLKARYTMRLLARSSDVNGDLENILEYISHSFTSAAEEFSYNTYGVGVNMNPFFGVYWSRAGEVASNSLFLKLQERQDPRIRRCYVEPQSNLIVTPESKDWNMADNGNVTQSQQSYTTSIFVASETAPTHLLSYHEVLFLKAEALARLGRDDEAKAALKDAVVAGMANTEVNVEAALNSGYWTSNGTNPFTNVQAEITPAEASEYFDNHVAPLFDADPVKETMIQKYIAFWNANGESTEAYNDVRRMKALNEDVYGFRNPNKFPLRCPYGGDDTTTNPNVQEAYGDGQYVFTENVWWAGGSR